MLRSQFKDNANADDDVLEIWVIEGLAIPFVSLVLTFPEFSRQLSCAIFPSTADAHALIQFQAHIWELALPNVVFFEFFLDSSSKSLSGDFEEVFHSVLRVERMNLGVSPDLIEGILDIVNESTDLAKFKRI